MAADDGILVLLVVVVGESIMSLHSLSSRGRGAVVGGDKVGAYG